MWSGKGQLSLRRFSHMDLVEAGDSVHEPFVFRVAKGVADSLVSERYGHGDDLGD